MLKSIITIILLFAGVLSFAQINETDSQSRKQGKWEGQFESGKLRYTGQFVNNKEVGTFTFYFEETGKVQAKNVFTAGSKEVVTKAYYSNGEVKWTGTYIDKKRNGEWNFYTKKAVLVSTENYSMGKKHGVFKYYYKTGGLSEEIIFVNDVEDGAYAQYYKNGYPRTKGNFSNGSYNGLTTLYHDDGTKLMEGKFEYGIKHGAWREYYRGGEIKLQTKYEKGKTVRIKRENGDFIDYFDNGIPSEECSYQNGKKDGNFKVYYDQGEWIKEQLPSSQPGMPVEYKQMLVNRQVKIEGEYIEGMYDGDIYFYTERGVIEKIETYQDGELTGTRTTE